MFQPLPIGANGLRLISCVLRSSLQLKLCPSSRGDCEIVHHLCSARAHAHTHVHSSIFSFVIILSVLGVFTISIDVCLQARSSQGILPSPTDNMGIHKNMNTPLNQTSFLPQGSRGPSQRTLYSNSVKKKNFLKNLPVSNVHVRITVAKNNSNAYKSVEG